ncbi:MAG: EamA family transporter [Gordonia sp. (in: high G+C Gram-positive bacteria)]
MDSRTRNAALAPWLVLAGLLCQEVGASVAVTLFPVVGPIGMVALRLVFSALVLLMLAGPTRGARPQWRAAGRAAWCSVAGFGLVLAAMNAFFYLSLERLPLGAAVTIEILGPLVLSVIAGRPRWRSVLLAVVAGLGVVALGGGLHDLDLLGVACALAAAVLWVGYILLAQATGAHFRGISGLATATVLGALLIAPIAVATTGVGTLLEPRILAAGLAIAVLSSAIPYALELSALRYIGAGTFAILLALAPALAALVGFVVLDQNLTPLAITGIACVMGASIGAVRGERRIGRAPA